MSADKLGDLIRSKKDHFTTPNIFEYCGNETVEVHFQNFRSNKQSQEIILFFEYENLIYFPVWFEFRSINNNLLFLFYEYQINDFKTLIQILTSSLEKEEGYVAKFKALIYKTKLQPSFCFALPDFIIAEEDRIIVAES
jgi:hypothetical protein